MVSDRDKEFLNQMLEQLYAYKNGKIRLVRLYYNLNALFSCVENDAPEWRISVQSQINKLDDIYSVVSDEFNRKLTKKEIEMIEGIISEIENLIKSV